MSGKVGRKVVTVDLDVDQVHGERELVRVQHAILKTKKKCFGLLLGQKTPKMTEYC